MVSGLTGLAPHVAWYETKKSASHTCGETRSVPSHSCGRVSSSLRIFSACVALSNGECTSHATAASAPHVAVKPVLPTDCGTQWPCSCECRGFRPNTWSPL